MIATLIGAGLLAATVAPPLWPLEIQALNKVIRKQAAELAGPHDKVQEFVEGRKTLHADVSGDGREDLVVLFTLERGDLWVQYLAAISHAGTPLAIAEVARKGGRAVDLDRAEGTLIQLTTRKYALGDAACCPSLLARATYTLKGRHLKELKPPLLASSRVAPPNSMARRPRQRP